MSGAESQFLVCCTGARPIDEAATAIYDIFRMYAGVMAVLHVADNVLVGLF
jgi:hypothetical protein